jgi:hypothetical protein
LLDAGGSVELVLEQRLDGGDAGFHRLQQGLGHGAPAFNCAASERAMPMAPAVNCLPSLDSTAAAVKRVENRIWSAVLFSMNLFSSALWLCFKASNSSWVGMGGPPMVRLRGNPAGKGADCSS